MKRRKQIEYDLTSEAFRHHQILIHQSIASYTVIAIALIGSSFLKEVSLDLKIVASSAGIFVSVLWFLFTSRMSTYNRHYIKRLKDMEGRTPGLLQKDDALKKTDTWLHRTPGTTDVIVYTYLICFFFFTAITIYHSVYKL